MKFTKFVKGFSTFTLIGASALGIYFGIKTKELLIEATEAFVELNRKASEFDLNINLLSKQLNELRSI